MNIWHETLVEAGFDDVESLLFQMSTDHPITE